VHDAVSGKRERQERFAKELRGLRAEAGNPSFRVMAAKSRTVSHATLHEAAKGTRFPSWLTTEAFVEACGGDVDDWRTRWREALGEPETATPEPRTPETATPEPRTPETVAPEPRTAADEPETPSHKPENTSDGTADESDGLSDEPHGHGGDPVVPADGPHGHGGAAGPHGHGGGAGSQADTREAVPDLVTGTPAVPVGEPGSGAPPAATADATAADPVPTRRRHRRAALILAGCTAVAAAGTVAYLQPWHGQRTPIRAKSSPHPTTTWATAPATPATTSAAATPELTVPRIKGDQSLFVADVTIPDGTVVEPGQQFTKTWEIANIGTVPWHGRFLERVALPADNGTCSTPSKVPIPDTKPGTHVRISVTVMAPDTPGSCWVGWKMVDGEDRPFLPGSRPVYFVVNVAQ